MTSQKAAHPDKPQYLGGPRYQKSYLNLGLAKQGQSCFRSYLLTLVGGKAMNPIAAPAKYVPTNATISARIDHRGDPAPVFLQQLDSSYFWRQ